jgi:hypothetical protein
MVMHRMVADISDGKGFFSGRVHDISRLGLSLYDIPQKIDAQSSFLTVIVSDQGDHFKLQIRPCWQKTGGLNKIIGGRVEQSTFSWTEFVMRMEPGNEEISGNS